MPIFNILTHKKDFHYNCIALRRGAVFNLSIVYIMSNIKIYVDFDNKTDLFTIEKGITTFRNIEDQFLKIPEFNGKQIYGIYNDARDEEMEDREFSTPPEYLESKLTIPFLIITDLEKLKKYPEAVKMYNIYNDNWSTGHLFKQRETGEYKKSPRIELKGGRRKSRRKSFRQKKRRSSRHKKNVSK